MPRAGRSRTRGGDRVRGERNRGRDRADRSVRRPRRPPSTMPSRRGPAARVPFHAKRVRTGLVAAPRAGSRPSGRRGRMRTLTSAATVSEKPISRRSFRPSPFGEKRLGVTETRPSVRLTRSGTRSSRPRGPRQCALARRRCTTRRAGSRRATVAVCLPARVHTRSTTVATSATGRVDDLDGHVRRRGQPVAHDGGVSLAVAVRRDRLGRRQRRLDREAAGSRLRRSATDRWQGARSRAVIVHV